MNEQQVQDYDVTVNLVEADKMIYLERQAHLLERHGYKVVRPGQVDRERREKEILVGTRLN